MNVEVNSLKKDSFEAWISSLPESVKEILYDKLTSDQLYATFFPSVFHNALSKEEIILVFSILKSKNEIEQCRLESSEKLYDLRKYLQFIVENDKSRFLSIFQNRATKENLIKAKDFTDENKNIISDILYKKENDWDKIINSSEGLDISLKNDRSEYLNPFVNLDTEKIKEDTVFWNCT